MISAHKKHHVPYYLFTALIQLAGLLIIIWAGGDRQIQMIFIILMALGYVLWGLIHHKIHHTLHAKIVLEYILLASLGITLMYFLFQ